jgi:hypothetical protein
VDRTQLVLSCVRTTPVAVFAAHLHSLCHGCSRLLCYMRVFVVEVLLQNLAPHGLIIRGLDVTTTACANAELCLYVP